jgi:hypothetical protein
LSTQLWLRLSESPQTVTVSCLSLLKEIVNNAKPQRLSLLAPYKVVEFLPYANPLKQNRQNFFEEKSGKEGLSRRLLNLSQDCRLSSSKKEEENTEKYWTLIRPTLLIYLPAGLLFQAMLAAHKAKMSVK